MDGWVTIGIKGDSKQLERDLKNAEKKLQQFENQAEKLTEQKAKIETTIEINETEYKQKIDALNQKYKAEIQANTKWGNIQDQPKIDTKYDQLRYQLEIAYGKSLDQNKAKLDDINKKIQENVHNQGLVKNQVEETYNKLNQISSFDNIKNSINSVGDSVEKVTKKVARWGLAVFGVRSAYLFIRQAMGTLSQYDEQMANNVEYIRYLIASTLKPLIENIIQLAYKLLVYINYISQALFGVNLFANASTEAFGKQNKALSGSVKQAKQLQKTLAGFDEMNILQDNGDVSSGGGGGGTDISLPNFPKMEDVPIPSWLQWILDYKDEVIAGILGIAGALSALNLGFSGVKALGIGIAIAGIVYTIEKIIDYLNDPTFENFIGILEGIALAVVGVAIAIGAWPVAIAGAIAFVILQIVKHFDEIMGLFNTLTDWLDKNVLGGLKKMFGPLGNLLYAPIKGFVELAKGAFESFYGGIKQVIEGVMKIFKGDFWGGIKQIFGGLLNIMLAPLKGFLKGAWAIIQQIYGFFRDLGGKVGEVVGGAFKTVINGVLGAIERILNFPIKQINKLIGVINKIPGINLGKLSTFNLPRLAKGGIINQPGSGVMVGSAVAGERGREGVIPLTDSQQMALLGEAIGRYITVNANITNTMNGRVISRELQKLNNESDFAYNR